MKLRWFLLLYAIGTTPLLVWAQPAPPGSPAIVITEIMYNSPEAGADSLEFIEIRNPSPEFERSLAGFAFTEGIEFAFPDGYIIQPHQYILIAKDSVAFENTFGLEAFQWTNSSLLNSGETIIIRSNLNTVVDSVSYTDSSPWPTEASGNGASLVLCNDTLDNSGSINWSAANTNTGIVVNGITIFANPGTGCSVGNAINELQQSKFTIFPNPNRGEFTLAIPSFFSAGNYELEIVDITGKNVFSQFISLQAAQKFQVQKRLPSGSYVLTLSGKSFHSEQQFVVIE